MKALPEFRLETHFAKWEFKARHHMTASDAESLSMRDLLAMATDGEREEFDNLWLGYTETFGAPDLRETIAALYPGRNASEVLCFAGASEGIYAANRVILDKDSHAIAITPNYQSHESLPLAICGTTGIPLDPDDNWSLDIDRIAQAIKPNTRLVTINFPHNPTGANLPRDRLDALVTLCRKHGIYILSDEIFNGLGRTATEHMPYITELYERGLSLNVMSKAYGMPGLRIGWIASADRELLQKMERAKHYLSICNSAPSERLAKIGLMNRDQILARNCKIIDENLVKLDAFFDRYADLFEWKVSDASCMAFPRYKGADGVENFTQRLLEDAGVLLLPGSIYSSELGPTPTDRFRIGFGRAGIDQGIAAMDTHLQQIYGTR
jgi:aspartate/methionine/tyrosine aminotransferase